jgi:hypothetical protein
MQQQYTKELHLANVVQLAFFSLFIYFYVKPHEFLHLVWWSKTFN